MPAPSNIMAGGCFREYGQFPLVLRIWNLTCSAFF